MGGLGRSANRSQAGSATGSILCPARHNAVQQGVHSPRPLGKLCSTTLHPPCRTAPPAPPQAGPAPPAALRLRVAAPGDARHVCHPIQRRHRVSHHRRRVEISVHRGPALGSALCLLQDARHVVPVLCVHVPQQVVSPAPTCCRRGAGQPSRRAARPAPAARRRRRWLHVDMPPLLNCAGARCAPSRSDPQGVQTAQLQHLQGGAGRSGMGVSGASRGRRRNSIYGLLYIQVI